MIFLYDVSYATAQKSAGIERLDVRRCELRDHFVIKLEGNERFNDWFPLNETPVYPMRVFLKVSGVAFPYRQVA